MLFNHLFFSVFLLLSPHECKSIIEENDTALELLNNCKCVTKGSCYKGYVNVAGIDIIDLRIGEVNDSETVEISCSKPSFSCCKDWKDGLGPGVDNQLSLYKKEEKSTNEKENSKCGRPNPTINMRIHVAPGDISTAMDGEFPWMASIHRKNVISDTFQFRCGGSLISDSVVLTAAHCVYSSRKKPSEIRIIANSRKEMTEIGANISDERKVKKILVHPDYYSGGAHNDIALVFLTKSFNESKELNSICLPRNDSTFDRTKCLVAGWGEGNTKSFGEDKILSKVELSIVEHEKCESLLRKTKLGADFKLHESSLCAGGEIGKDACRGDGGGPLACPTEDGHFVQVGIVSWGVECSKENRPGVYTDVGKFVEWIQDSV